MKFPRISIVLLAALVALLASCGDSDDPTDPVGDTTAPTVSSVSPADTASDVPLSEVVQIVFNEDMDPATATGNVSITPGGVTGLSWLNARTLSVTHPAWAEGVGVTATVTTGLSDVAGNALAQNFVWNFTSASTPTLVGSNPANLEENVNRAIVISLFFSTEMDLASLENAIVVDDGLTKAALPVLGVLSAGPENSVLVTLNSPLPAFANVTVSVDTGARSAAGLPLAAPVSFGFVTGADIIVPPTLISIVPADGSIIDPNTSEIVLTFSKAMDPSSFQTSMISAQWEILFRSSGLSSTWSLDETTLTISLLTPLPAELPIAWVVDSYADVDGNIQTTPIDYRVDVAGSGDPWPFADGSRFVYFEDWSESRSDGGSDSGMGEYFYQVEGQGGEIFNWASYDPSYVTSHEHDIFEKTATALKEVGSHYEDEFTGEVEDDTLSPGVEWARFPFAVGSWSGSTTVTFTGGTASATYNVEVFPREDVLSVLESGAAEIVWLDCWKTVRSWSVNSGGSVVDSGTATLWFAPSIGIVKVITHEVSDDEGVTVTEDSTEDLIRTPTP